MNTRKHNRFALGSAVFRCRICTRATRETGDNADVELCPQCYELCGEENHHSDTGGRFYAGPEAILRLIADLEAKGGLVRRWDTLKALAKAAIEAKGKA